MKIQRSIMGFAVIVMVLIALIIFLAKKPAQMVLPSSVETNTASLAITQPAGNKPSQSIAAAPVPTNVTTTEIASGHSTSLAPDEGTQAKDDLAILNDVPIVFYGKLEDQFGSPVAGAQVAASIRIYNGAQSTVERSFVTSDASGLFQVNGGKGESLGLMPRKDGYTLASTGTEFKYSYMYKERFTPNPNSPVVFKMWKMQGAEPLVGIDQRYKLQYTNEPFNIDLRARKIVATGGDLKITLTRSPGIVSERTLQDWGVQVEAVEGGLIETSAAEAQLTYSAPESGYKPGETYLMSTSTHSWHGGFGRVFFLKSRGGQVFSKVDFGISINQNPDDCVWVEVHGVANTNGSRNWEATASQ